MRHGWFHKIPFIISAFILATSLAHAQEIYPFYRGIRALGMGGAGVATVNDETSLFINPAGLGKLRGSILTVGDLELESSPDSYTAYTSPAASGKSITDPAGLMAIMSDPQNKGKHFHARAQVFPSIVTTNFGFGVFGKYQLDAEMERNVANPTYMRTNYINDFGAVLGFCLRLFDGRVKLGVAGKALNRVELAQDIPTSAPTISMQALAAEGGGIGSDAGLILTGPWMWLPTIGATLHDMGDTKFNLGSGYFYKTGVVPNPQKQSLDVGVALFPIHGKRIRSSWTVEYRDAMNPDQVAATRRVHAGLELNFGDVLFVRGGYNQGYYTAGLELAVNTIQFQAATYGEEIGTASTPREDRRYVGKLAIRF